MKLKLFSKLFGEMWACRRSWAKLRFLAAPPQCKLETASPDASWMKLLAKYPFGTSSYKAAHKVVSKGTVDAEAPKGYINSVATNHTRSFSLDYWIVVYSY